MSLTSFLVSLFFLESLFINDINGAINLETLNFSISYLGYDSQIPGTTIPQTQAEISGFAWFQNTATGNGNIFYGVSDNLVEDKGWIKYEYNSTSYKFTLLGGTSFGDNSIYEATSFDSESIAVIGLSFENGLYDDGTSNTPTNLLDNNLYGYFIVSSEGHRTYDTETYIMLYDMNGTYLTNLNDDIPDVFGVDMSSETYGLQNNGAFEGLDISNDYNYISYVNEEPLLQDVDDCPTCHRIVLSSFDRNISDPSELSMTTEYMFLYESDGSYWYPVDIVFLDVTKFNSNSDSTPIMPALILERFPVTSSFFYNRIYLVDLDMNTYDDISNCDTLLTDCPSVTAIDKLLVFDFEEDINDNEFPYDTTSYNFEGISIYQDSNNMDDCIQRLIAINDNGDSSTISNVFISLEVNYCQDIKETDDSMGMRINQMKGYWMYICIIYCVVVPWLL